MTTYLSQQISIQRLYIKFTYIYHDNIIAYISRMNKNEM